MTCLKTLKAGSFFLAMTSLAACAGGPKPGEPNAGVGGEFTGVSAHPIGLYFVGLDRNQDKVTTRAELAAGIKTDWAKFDSNQSAASFQNWTVKAFGSRTALPSFLSFDSNLDGIVSKDEFETRLTEEFSRLDRDGDGQIVRSELVFTVQARQRGGRGSDQRGGEDSQRGGRPPR